MDGFQLNNLDTEFISLFFQWKIALETNQNPKLLDYQLV